MPPTRRRSADPLRVVIAGGGVAALETLIGVRGRARGRLDVTLVSSTPEFVYRPLEVGEPFGLGAVRRYPLAELAADQGATLRLAALARVEPEGRLAVLDSGESLAYDALVVAVGAAAVPAYDHGIVFDRELKAATFDEALGDVAAGLAGGVAFVVPPGAGWTLPAYELSLMTAAWRPASRAPEMAVTLITAERRPLDAFGGSVAEAVGQIIENAGVELLTGTSAYVESDTLLRAADDGRWITADRIVSLPAATGPRVRGLPHDRNGFIPVDRHGRVEGVDGVYAAGDGTVGAIKQGGLAAQQADAVVEQVAGLTRGDVVSPPPRVLRGLLRTAEGPRYLRAELDDPEGTSAVSARPLWWPPSKIASSWLSPQLALLDAGHLPARPLSTGGIARSPAS